VTPFDPNEITSTPYLAPLVADLPIRMRDTAILTIVYRTDQAASQRLLPAPLRPTGDLVVMHVYWMHDAEWFGVYGESAWQLPTETPDGVPAVYSPFLFLDSDGAVATGREVYGQPKKGGEVALEARGDVVVGVVRRNGIEIATSTIVYKQQTAAADALDQLIPGSGTNVNLRVLTDSQGGRTSGARHQAVRRRRAQGAVDGTRNPGAETECAGPCLPAAGARGGTRVAPQTRLDAGSRQRRPHLRTLSHP
jgi:acetoacetate decarboxylase